MKDVLENLPRGFYCVTDDACTLSENMLIPFTGADHFDSANVAFNYFLYQLRIWIEMAFGRTVKIFGILNGKINGSLDRATAILSACARLHNLMYSKTDFVLICLKILLL